MKGNADIAELAQGMNRTRRRAPIGGSWALWGHAPPQVIGTVIATHFSEKAPIVFL